MLEPKNIDKAWKVTIWLYGIDAIIRFPLRFFKSFFSNELDILFMVRFLIFLLAIFLTSVIYVKSTKKPVDNQLKFRVSLYVAIITSVAWIFFTDVFEEVFVSTFGGLFESIAVAIVSFLVVYFVLPLGNRFMAKDES